jgi:ADP-dependent NAD(P)H-hydrate dehydratase / NAD(P)H-hydrate epimerase
MLPDWLEPLPDAAGQRAADAWAIDDLGIPSLDLMERAGHGLAELVQETVPDGDEAKLTADARANVDRLDAPPAAFDPGQLAGAAVIVDALLGTGISGAPRPPFDAAVRAVGAAGVPVVAADGPSGVDASTGEVAGDAVRATATATFAAAKPGLWIEPGKTRAGDVRVVDIGIPPGAPGAPDVGLIRDAALLAALPGRDRDSTKFASGFVLVAGGSTGLTGAPVLASLAAMRAGAGYVTACVPAPAQPIVATHLVEVMSRALPERDGGHVEAGAATVLELTERGGALVLGPGLGRTDGAVAFARALAAQATVPLLLDADGLFAFAGALERLRDRPGPTVLTPHEGEMGRLLGRPSAEVKAHRLACVRAAADASGAVVVLKGDDTLVAAPGGPVAVSPGATPALATAGTGDVLSGVVGALLAQGLDPFAAAAAAVRLHARAGRLAAAEHGVQGVIASDVVARLPAARRIDSAA